MERAQRQRCWKGVGDGEACQGSETVELERAGDGRAGKDLKTVELARARRRYRAGPRLEYGGAGQSSETAELFRGSTAELSPSHGQRTPNRVSQVRAGQSSDLGDGGALLGPRRSWLGARGWRNWPVLASGDGKGSETTELERARR